MQKTDYTAKRNCSLCKLNLGQPSLLPFVRKLSLDQALAQSSSLQRKILSPANQCWVKELLYKSKSEPIMSSSFASTWFNNQHCACSNIMTSSLKSSDMSTSEMAKRCIIKIDGYSYIIGKLGLWLTLSIIEMTSDDVI